MEKKLLQSCAAVCLIQYIESNSEHIEWNLNILNEP